MWPINDFFPASRDHGHPVRAPTASGKTPAARIRHLHVPTQPSNIVGLFRTDECSSPTLLISAPIRRTARPRISANGLTSTTAAQRRTTPHNLGAHF